MRSSRVPFLLACLVLLPVVAAQSMKCPAGSFFSGGSCSLCPPGTYRTNRFFEPKTRCNPCPPGTFNPVSGAVTPAVCRPCFPDTFAPRSSAKCAKCPTGSVANRGASVCLRCGPGFQASPFEPYDGNKDKCVPCRKNTYSEGDANRECTMCPPFMSTPKGASSKSQCSLCPPGREAYPGSNGCEKCSLGSFKAGLDGRCENCPPGTIAAKQGARRCVPCAPGTRERRFRNKCAPCKPGFTTFGKGARFCRRIGAPCPTNFFETKDGDCDNCLTGHFLNTTTMKCETCPAGTISPGGRKTSCKKCPPGQQPTFERTECKCLAGRFFGKDGKCEKCPPGTFINDDYIGFARDECIKCDPGEFADKRGSLNCKKCPRGTVASQSGATKCATCPKGLIPNIPDSGDEDEIAIGCVVPTTACPLGWKRKEVGATSGPIFGCVRISCAVGTPKEDIGKTCVPCEPGEFLDEEKTRCKRCPADSVSNGGIVTKCKKCPNGLRQDRFRDPAKCTCRMFGFGIQKGQCEKCPPGSFSSDESDVCSLCAPGTFSKRTKAGGCDKCPSGTFAKNAGSTKCKACPSGTVANRFARATDCIPL